jgi:hypothetical protein
MLNEEQIAMMHRHLTLVGAIAKHSMYSDQRVTDVVGEAEYPLLKQAVDQHDVDVASLFAELRIFHQMFDAKLEGFRNGFNRNVAKAEEPKPAESGERVGVAAEQDSSAAGEAKPARKRRKRSDTKTDTGGEESRARPVDTGDD